MLNPKSYILNSNFSGKGFTLIEIIIVLAILTIFLLSAMQLGTYVLSDTRLNQSTEKAAFLAEEAMEAVKNFRDRTQWSANGVSQLTIGSQYYPDSSTGSWNLSLGTETIENKYQRSIVFERAYRDSSDNLISSGGTEDQNTRKASVKVSWIENGKLQEIILETYLMNIRNN